MRRMFAVVIFMPLAIAAAYAQAKPELAKEVRAFVKVDAPVVALTHVRVIDGTGAPPRSDQTLVIRDGKIVAMGDAAKVSAPDGAQLPGLVGMHDHLFYPAPQGPPAMYPEHASSFPRLYLAGGVTSIRTTGSVEPYADLETKKLIANGQMPGPKMHITGPYI